MMLMVVASIPSGMALNRAITHAFKNFAGNWKYGAIALSELERALNDIVDLNVFEVLLRNETIAEVGKLRENPEFIDPNIRHYESLKRSGNFVQTSFDINQGYRDIQDLFSHCPILANTLCERFNLPREMMDIYDVLHGCKPATWIGNIGNITAILDVKKKLDELRNHAFYNTADVVLGLIREASSAAYTAVWIKAADKALRNNAWLDDNVMNKNLDTRGVPQQDFFEKALTCYAEIDQALELKNAYPYNSHITQNTEAVTYLKGLTTETVQTIYRQLFVWSKAIVNVNAASLCLLIHTTGRVLTDPKDYATALSNSNSWILGAIAKRDGLESSITFYENIIPHLGSIPPVLHWVASRKFEKNVDITTAIGSLTVTIEQVFDTFVSPQASDFEVVPAVTLILKLAQAGTELKGMSQGVSTSVTKFYSTHVKPACSNLLNFYRGHNAVVTEPLLIGCKSELNSADTGMLVRIVMKEVTESMRRIRQLSDQRQTVEFPLVESIRKAVDMLKILADTSAEMALLKGMHFLELEAALTAIERDGFKPRHM